MFKANLLCIGWSNKRLVKMAVVTKHVTLG